MNISLGVRFPAALLKLGQAGLIARGKGSKCWRNPFVMRVNQEGAGRSDFERPVLMHLDSTFSHSLRKAESAILGPYCQWEENRLEKLVSWDKPSRFLPLLTLPLSFPPLFPAWGGYSQQPELLSPVI